MNKKELKRIANTVSSSDFSDIDFEALRHKTYDQIHRQIAESMLKPPSMLRVETEGPRLTATEIGQHQFFHCAVGTCQPHRRRHVDCRVIEPKQLTQPPGGKDS